MCGFNGFLGIKDTSIQSQQILQAMSSNIKHRGPNDSGIWFDVDAQIGFGHRRLSIMDLSAAGHQPMTSKNGRYVIAYNGEIYNHLELRKILGDGYSWRGSSDTETMLECFEAWGIQTTIERTSGMFAFSVWDRQEKTLILARDRAGEKPLYYGWQRGVFLFGSELKALQAHPAFCSGIDRNALDKLIRYNSIPAPYSIWSGINKLMPGYLLKVSLNHPDPELICYWSGKDTYEKKSRNRFTGSKTQAVNELEIILSDAVDRQMISDVPVGAFLSGGVDSSLIVALMQARGPGNVRTFSIGHAESSYNEAHYAKRVANHLGTEHTEYFVTDSDVLEVIQKLPVIYSEPFADSSQIPTYLVSQLAKQSVTVALSGDGGDELFCGYNRHIIIGKLNKFLSYMPSKAKRYMSHKIQSYSPESLSRFCHAFGLLKKTSLPGDKLHKLIDLLNEENLESMYERLISNRLPESGIVIPADDMLIKQDNQFLAIDLPTSADKIMLMDFLNYLPDDILTKVDRASMSNSLETRAPFLDHQVIEFAWSLPLEYKLIKGVSKYLLRQILYKYVPRELIDRPKMGFGIPMDKLLRGPLRVWASDLLNRSLIHEQGFFDSSITSKKWSEHLSGDFNHASLLWSILMFQAWFNN